LVKCGNKLRRLCCKQGVSRPLVDNIHNVRIWLQWPVREPVMYAKRKSSTKETPTDCQEHPQPTQPTQHGATPGKPNDDEKLELY
jgi:hypothetical protein